MLLAGCRNRELLDRHDELEGRRAAPLVGVLVLLYLAGELVEAQQIIMLRGRHVGLGGRVTHFIERLEEWLEWLERRADK